MQYTMSSGMKGREILSLFSGRRKCSTRELLRTAATLAASPSESSMRSARHKARHGIRDGSGWMGSGFRNFPRIFEQHLFGEGADLRRGVGGDNEAVVSA